MGVFWWHVLKTCDWHQSMWIPAPSIPSLSPFQFLVCFARLVSEFAKHTHVRASPFLAKDGLLRSGGQQTWESTGFPIKNSPFQGWVFPRQRGWGRRAQHNTTQSQAGLRWCQARWLLSWDLCLCTGLSTGGCVLQHLPGFFPFNF